MLISMLCIKFAYILYMKYILNNIEYYNACKVRDLKVGSCGLEVI